ncbi:MAG: hypothetical protein ACTSXC_07445 [Candidatus Freyarchaeota archaeon]
MLRRLGVYEKVVTGEIKCHFCGSPLTIENIGGFLQIDGMIVMVCNKPECLIKAALASAGE